MNKKQLRAKKKAFDKQRNSRSQASKSQPSRSQASRSQPSRPSATKSSSQKSPFPKPQRAKSPSSSQNSKSYNNFSNSRSSNYNQKAKPNKNTSKGFAKKIKHNTTKFNNKLTPEQNEARLRRQEIINNRPRKNIKRKKNYTVYYILLSIILIVSGTVLARNYLFQVSQITVVTTNSYDKKKIINDSGILVGDNILKLNTSRIEKSILEKNTSLDGVDVSAKFPDKFEIEIVVATPEFILANKDKTTYYTLSTKQRIIGIDTKKPTIDTALFTTGITLPEVALGTFVDLSKDNAFSKLKSIQKSLDRLEYKKVKLIDLTDIYDIKVSLSRGIDIVLGNSSELDYKLKFAKKVLDEEISTTEKGQLVVSTVGKCNFIPDATKKEATKKVVSSTKSKQ